MNQNPRERGQKPIEAVSFRRIATVDQLHLEYTHTHTHTHTVSFTVSRGIIKLLLSEDKRLYLSQQVCLIHR